MSTAPSDKTPSLPPSNTPHGLTSTASNETPSTSSHPPASKPDPTTQNDRPKGRLSSTATSGPAELANLKVRLHSALRQFQDFPTPGILFEDIMPIFADPDLHRALVRALEMAVLADYGEHNKPDIIVALEARGFLFGPSLALSLGAGFVPVRKRGKLPGPCETAAFKKEYGEDFFQIQKDAVKPGQKVLVVDDILATGGSASAAGSLVKNSGGTLIGYLFLMELDFLKGRDKLNAPVYTLLTGQEKN